MENNTVKTVEPRASLDHDPNLCAYHCYCFYLLFKARFKVCQLFVRLSALVVSVFVCLDLVNFKSFYSWLACDIMKKLSSKIRILQTSYTNIFKTVMH